MEAEKQRIQEKNQRKKHWLQWGPYLSERQWGTVREDYSYNGEAWDYFSFQDAKSRAYRWGEDGIAGISDDFCNLCFSVALWNGKDPILKERLFGLSNSQGNHGEDVKELYYYLENTPTHSYMKYLYKYPIEAFPYDELIKENAARGLKDREFEILDTQVFDDRNYFDVWIEYAKADYNDILIKISAHNLSNHTQEIHLLPTLLMRNFWSFNSALQKPVIDLEKTEQFSFVNANHPVLGDYNLYFDQPNEFLFTENETNRKEIFNQENDHPFKKDLFHQAVINQDFSLATRNKFGTKFSPYYKLKIEAGKTHTICLRLTQQNCIEPFKDFESIFATRVHECNEFYKTIIKTKQKEHQQIQRQAFAGMLWNKQYYNYDVQTWLEGDDKMNPLPPERRYGRNSEWKTLRNNNILLMPDKWEYPWYAAWDSAYHSITMAKLDIEFAKNQLLLFTKEWYMSPNGQIPAYEWHFSDVNPPVQAWAALMIYQIEKKDTGWGDVHFLKRLFNKLALNFTWWVNRLDRTGNNVFEGGFLGLDNIGIFDRSKNIPGGAFLEQVDGTSWMALYCVTMLKISLEISKSDADYEDMATKYFSHFIHIAEALNYLNEEGTGIWDINDEFFYDQLIFPDGNRAPIKVRSIVGMLSLIAVLHIDQDTFNQLPQFKKSFLWFKKHRLDKLRFPVIQESDKDESIFLSLVPIDRIGVLMNTLLDEKEFLSDYGIRSLSKIYEKPYQLPIDGVDYEIAYDPSESTSYLFGGNSNWRGPIWFPINYLMIDSLRELHKFFGEEVKYSFPTGGDQKLNFNQITQELSLRLISIFEKQDATTRPVQLLYKSYYEDEYFSSLIDFYEYFNSENGRGVGASHQTGWTALVANLIDELDA